MAVCANRHFFIFLIIVTKATCYEKTLRKIVRNQSKMVQRPFSEVGIGSKLSWRNSSLDASDDLMFSGHLQTKTKFHKMQGPKISTLLSPIDMRSYGKTAFSRKISGRNQIELRLARNTLNASASPVQVSTEGVFFPDRKEAEPKNTSTDSEEIAIDTYYKIPQSKESTFHANGKRDNAAENTETIIIPKKSRTENDSLLVKSIFRAKPNAKVKLGIPTSARIDVSPEFDSDDKLDYLIQSKPTAAAMYSYNASTNMYTCNVLYKCNTGIDAQEKFLELDIEPPWMSKTHYWNRIFDSRYEALMRNPNWPPLKVILIPRTHVDTIWKKSFERYYNDSVHHILSNVVKKLRYYNNLTFSWNEVSHLSHWWNITTGKSRAVFRRLIQQGRLEITTGGWVETDEATSHLFGLVHILVEGQQWLKNHLNYSPNVAWLTNTVAHSPTMAYLLSASGIHNLVITNLHYSWEEYLAEYQNSDFIWVQSWECDKFDNNALNALLGRIGDERTSKHSVLTHFLQFNSAGFKACGPKQSLCSDNYDFLVASENPEAYTYNMKEKAEILLEQYSKTGTISPHNTIIAPLGEPYRYDTQSEFDYQYNNYQKLADYINSNKDIYKASVEFGTAKEYFNTIVEKHKSYRTIKGDFVNFADVTSGSPAYWTGYFTSRPLFKILVRRLLATLRSTEILFSFAISLNVFQGFDTSSIYSLLTKARENVARLQDRNVVSGTLSSNAVKYAYKLMLATVKKCWYIQEVSTSLLSIKPDKTIHSPYVRKYVYRDGEFISMFKTVAPGDQVYIFNSLCHERTEIVELIVRNPNIRIIDHNKKEVTIQINPVWKYSADNSIRLSRRFYKITFAIVIPPMTLELYRIKETYDGTQNAATIYCVACSVDEVQEGLPFPFLIQPIEVGDIQLESYKHRLIFDEHTGFLKTVVEKISGTEKLVVIDYGAFKSSDVNSGMFLFNTNVSKPLRDVLKSYRTGQKTKLMLIISGQVTTELTSIYGRLLQSTVKIFNLLNSPLSNTIYVESKVDYEYSPKNRELEVFMSIQTDISNGNPPEIYSDNNGFQYTARILNISRRIESNMYPMTQMSYIQDLKCRLTVVTDHAQGVTALQEGQLVLMLDRRVLFNDGRGTNEGLADSSATCHRHYILLENFIENYNFRIIKQTSLQLPSLSAVHMANSLDYQLDVFTIDRNKTDLCYYAYFPFVKTSFPCDVALLNFRIMINKQPSMTFIPSTALMILHRRSVSCNIDYDVQLHCSGDNNFSIEKTLHNIKAVYQTNLCGTNKGVRITTLNQINFPAMELTTLRIHF